MKHIKLFEQFITETKEETQIVNALSEMKMTDQQQKWAISVRQAFGDKQYENPETGRMVKAETILMSPSYNDHPLRKKLKIEYDNLEKAIRAKIRQENKEKANEDPAGNSGVDAKIQKLEQRKSDLEDKLSDIIADIEDIADEYGENDYQIQELEEKQRDLEYKIEKINDQIAKLKN